MAKSKKSPKSSRSAKPTKARRPKVATTARPLSGAALARTKRAWKDRAVSDLQATEAALAPAAPAKATRMLSDPRLPAVGTEIVRTYKDREYRVVRQADCFVYGGREYPSLSKIAREIIGGAQVNGFAFFGLVEKPKAAPAS